MLFTQNWEPTVYYDEVYFYYKNRYINIKIKKSLASYQFAHNYVEINDKSFDGLSALRGGDYSDDSIFENHDGWIDKHICNNLYALKQWSLVAHIVDYGIKREFYDEIFFKETYLEYITAGVQVIKEENLLVLKYEKEDLTKVQQILYNYLDRTKSFYFFNSGGFCQDNFELISFLKFSAKKELIVQLSPTDYAGIESVRVTLEDPKTTMKELKSYMQKTEKLRSMELSERRLEKELVAMGFLEKNEKNKGPDKG